MKQSHAEELEWARLRVLVATERVACAGELRRKGAAGARQWHDAQHELRRATLHLRSCAAEALRAGVNPYLWHDRFGRPRDVAEREYRLSA